MTDAEIKDRQEFAFEAAVRMRDRFLSAGGLGAHGRQPQARSSRSCSHDPTRERVPEMLFSKIVPNCKKLGLLDRNDDWLRRRFEEMGVIQFEDWADTGEEYTAFALDDRGPPRHARADGALAVRTGVVRARDAAVVAGAPASVDGDVWAAR